MIANETVIQTITLLQDTTRFCIRNRLVLNQNKTFRKKKQDVGLFRAPSNQNLSQKSVKPFNTSPYFGHEL